MSKRNKSNLAPIRERLEIEEREYFNPVEAMMLDKEEVAKEIMDGIRQTQETAALEKLLCYKNISTKGIIEARNQILQILERSDAILEILGKIGSRK